jgi:hypothetical protein
VEILKKSYSKQNILQKSLAGFEYKGFFDYLINNKKVITITLPYYDYLRGKVFIDDLKDAYETEVPYHFTIVSLINLLYDDLLSQVKRGAIHKDIAQFLIRGKEQYFNIQKREKRVLKALTDRVFEFESVIDEEEISPKNKGKDAYIEIKMRESEILRGEVLLHDLEPYLNGISVQFEELLVIRFLDFINEIKKDGNSVKIQQSIINRLSS